MTDTYSRMRLFQRLGDQSPCEMGQFDSDLLIAAQPIDLLWSLGEAAASENKPMIGYLGAFALAKDESSAPIEFDLSYGTVWMIADNLLVGEAVWGNKIDFDGLFAGQQG